MTSNVRINNINSPIQPKDDITFYESAVCAKYYDCLSRIIREKIYPDICTVRCFVKSELRKVHWFYDSNGDSGKSWCANYISSMYSEFVNLFSLSDNSVSSLTYAYNKEKPINIFDISKGCDKFPYTLFERIKDGNCFSDKYESNQKISFFHINLVIVLSNNLPDFDKLSLDRWSLYVCDVNGDFVPRDIQDYRF